MAQKALIYEGGRGVGESFTVTKGLYDEIQRGLDGSGRITRERLYEAVGRAAQAAFDQREAADAAADNKLYAEWAEWNGLTANDTGERAFEDAAAEGLWRAWKTIAL